MKKMRKLMTWLAGCALMLAAMPGLALAAGGKASSVVIVADTRKLDGILYWWAEMYNESHLFFAILTMLIIPIVGCILGWLADIVMTHIGIDLKHRELAEKAGVNAYITKPYNDGELLKAIRHAVAAAVA